MSRVEPKVTGVAHAVGITLRTTNKCPHLRGVIIDIATGTVVRTFEHKASKGDSKDQLHEIAQDFESELAAQTVEAVVIREAGYAKQAKLTDSVKNRYRAEGLCVAIARVVTTKVEVLDVQSIGRRVGKTGDDLTAAGEALAGGDFVEAATAAAAAAAP
jgi:hypothetical protein